MYPNYADQVHFIAIDVDGGESASQIRSFKESNGYTWPMIPADGDVLSGYRVTRQSTAVVLDSNGVILFRAGYGSAKNWQSLLDSLVGS